MFTKWYKLLKLFINNGANDHINNEGILKLVAYEGNITLLEYLINTCKSNYKVVYDSTAYFNKNETKQLLTTMQKLKLYLKIVKKFMMYCFSGWIHRLTFFVMSSEDKKNLKFSYISIYKQFVCIRSILLILMYWTYFITHIMSENVFFMLFPY